MKLLKKIFNSIYDVISVIWGGRCSDESWLIGLISLAVIIAIWGITFVLLNKLTKRRLDVCSLLAIAVTIAVVALFAVVCIAIDSPK